MSLCNQLEAKINQRDTLVERPAESVVRSVAA